MWLIANEKFISILNSRLPLALGFGALVEYDPFQFQFNEREIKNSYMPKFLKIEKITEETEK